MAIYLHESSSNSVYSLFGLERAKRSEFITLTKLSKSNDISFHSSVGYRASHLYREVTGSNPVEVLTFSGFYIRNCINCVHNCEDHS